MYPKILTIYGPLAVNSYGFFIALGLCLFMYLTARHERLRVLATPDQFYQIVFVGLVLGVVGGRLLYVLMEPGSFGRKWYEVFIPWEGGFSLLGTIVLIIVGLSLYLQRLGILVLPFLDLIAIYAPLLQAVARIGCFFAGCCYGVRCSSNMWWAVRYSHPDSLAPLGVWLHPTQLYSSVLSLGIFLLMRFVFEKRAQVTGQLFFMYLCLEGIARFGVDFWRGGVGQDWGVMGYRLIALGLAFGSLGWLLKNTYFKRDS